MRYTTTFIHYSLTVKNHNTIMLNLNIISFILFIGKYKMSICQKQFIYKS